MTEAARRVPDIPAAADEAQTARGPVPIDPQLLKHVAGGTEQAPKGGWDTPYENDTSAPKGGW